MFVEMLYMSFHEHLIIHYPPNWRTNNGKCASHQDQTFSTVQATHLYLCWGHQDLWSGWKDRHDHCSTPNVKPVSPTSSSPQGLQMIRRQLINSSIPVLQNHITLKIDFCWYGACLRVDKHNFFFFYCICNYFYYRTSYCNWNVP